jgi:hypothetical protein
VVEQLPHKERKMSLTAGCFQSDEAKLNKDIKKELECLTSITLGIEEIIPDG